MLLFTQEKKICFLFGSKKSTLHPNLHPKPHPNLTLTSLLAFSCTFFLFLVQVAIWTSKQFTEYTKAII